MTSQARLFNAAATQQRNDMKTGKMNQSTMTSQSTFTTLKMITGTNDIKIKIKETHSQMASSINRIIIM